MEETMQRDLFQIPTPSDTIASLQNAKTGSLLERFRISLRLDHILVLFLGLIFLYAFIYSIGVERGKKSAAQNIEVWQQKIREAIISETAHKETAMIDATKLPVAPAAQSQPAVVSSVDAPRSELAAAETPVSAAVQPAAVKTDADPSEAAKSNLVTGKYTVQVATLNNKEQADATLKKLSKAGYHAFLVPSGKYIQVCANGYEKKSGAVSLLNELKGKGLAPADAYVRNMPRMN